MTNTDRERSEPTAGPKRQRVLIVEDEEPMRMALERAFGCPPGAEYEFDVVSVGSASGAEEQLRSDVAGFHVVVLDVRLEHHYGGAMLQVLLTGGPAGAPFPLVIGYTAYYEPVGTDLPAERDLLRHFLRDGAWDLLRKQDVKPRDLVAEVLRELKRRDAMHDRWADFDGWAASRTQSELREYADRWIAFRDGGVVASGDLVSELQAGFSADLWTPREPVFAYVDEAGRVLARPRSPASPR